jgi:Domain of unknown function (DUF4304)
MAERRRKPVRSLWLIYGWAMPSWAATAMAAVVSELAPLFKDRDFRKRRHTFNRAASDGIVHVVAFQMGRYDPPGTIEIPPLRVNRYGEFAVNLGAFVPEMYTDGPRPPWIQEYHCALRTRLGRLIGPAGQEIWWSLDDPSRAAADVRSALETEGLSWLDRFPTQAAVLADYRRTDDAFFSPARARIDVALVLLARGEQAAAEELLRVHWDADLNKGHRKYFAAFLTENGLAQLMGDTPIE